MLLEADKKLFEINSTDEDIQEISKHKMKNFLKKKAIELTISYVDGLKEKHSKTAQYNTVKLETSKYLLDSRFTKVERELLFKLRSQTIQVKANFRNGNIENMLCELCHLFTCTQEHVLSCPVLTQKCTVVNTDTIIQHSFIYGSVERQLSYIHIYNQFWQTRESILNS